MLNVHGRTLIRPVVEPIAAALLQAGISPSMVALMGTVIPVLLAVTLIPTSHLFAAAVSAAIFTASGLFDGTVARLQGRKTRCGAALDASCDRITGAALPGAIAYWVAYHHGMNSVLLILALVTMGPSQVISYVKTRAETNGLRINSGLAECVGCLVIGLTGVELQGPGMDYALYVAMRLLTIGSVLIVVQHLYMVIRQLDALNPIAPLEDATNGLLINPDPATKPTGSTDSSN